VSDPSDVANPAPAGSRYYGVPTASIVAPTGEVRVYLRRRAIPPQESFAVFAEHVVEEGDRLDRIAADRLGDPEQSWRIADANAVLDPDDLTRTVGRRIRIAFPPGIPGASGV
jgi:hypothetical protein